MSSRAKRFALGFSVATLAAVALNLAPYLWTRLESHRIVDGFVVAGFPFTFRRTGGFAGVNEFHADALLYNVVLALAVAVLVGWFFTSNEFRRLIERWQGNVSHDEMIDQDGDRQSSSFRTADDLKSAMAAIIGSAPPDLVAFYLDGDPPHYPNSRINCLKFDSAREYNLKARHVSVIDRMGLWFLDDANDSNPFAYISKGPCIGMIIHFSHDPEPEMAFSSLRRFVDALHDAGAKELDIDEIQAESIRFPLNEEIDQLAAENTDDATFLLVTYLPITAELQRETKMALLSHGDFFVREAFAMFLARTALKDDIETARALAHDAHAQVQRQGRLALAAIEKKIHEK